MAEDNNSQKWLLNERLLQSQRLAALGELSACIAHEINNPLAIIRQEAEWIQHLTQKDTLAAEEMEELRGCVHQVVHEVDRCTEIVRNLLDFARKREPVVQAMDLNRVLEDMTRLVEKEARNRNILIERHYGPQLPQIFSDAPLLRQVFLNLLTNATQAIGQDGTVTITTGSGGVNAVQVTIRDTGCGIPEENLKKIFDPFFSTKPPGQGTGLGLSISHGLIQQLGGSISVSSRVGEGTTFTIIIPQQVLAGDYSP